MVCESNGSVVMKWKKKYEKLISKNTSYKRNGFNVTRKNLEIQNFSRNIEGLYECRIELGKYNWTDIVKINITMKGKFFTPNFNKHKDIIKVTMIRK